MDLHRPVGLLAATAFVIGSCSGQSDSTVAIDGLLDSEGQTVTIDRSADLPGQLIACLPESGEMTVQSFRADCVMPYINGLWIDPEGLLRPHTELAEAAKDWLLEKPSDGLWPIYYPEGVDSAKRDLDKMLADDKKLSRQVRVTELPDPEPKPSAAADSIYNQAGLLYLPNSYVVPGGIFNEQYGWDSYFIIVGLLGSAEWVVQHPTSKYWDVSEKRMVQLDETRAEELARRYFEIAKGMADNQAFMIENYGGFVPNANRIYYLTRSQPPLFAAESLLIYDFAKRYPHLAPYKETLAPYLDLKAEPTDYDEWIKHEILPAAHQYFKYFTDPETTTFGAHSNPRVVRQGRRSFYQFSPDGIGPAPEIVYSQLPGNTDLYAQDAAYLAATPEANPDQRFYNEKTGDPRYHLTQEFYLADRTVRASGYDLSGRYGAVGQYAADFSPVALMSLLYGMAQDLNEMAAIAEQSDPVSEEQLDELASTINDTMWVDEDNGPYYSDRLVKRGSPAQQPYLFGTAFYPLWAGVVPEDRIRPLLKAAQSEHTVTQNQVFYLYGEKGRITPVVKEETGEVQTCVLADPDNPRTCSDQYETESQPPAAMVSEANFGIPTSLVATGNQWDFSEAWAPVQHFASWGFQNSQQANLSIQTDSGWLSAVDIGFAKTGTIIEKYSAINPTQDVQVTSGYSKPQVGFGWTNGVYVEALQRSEL